jgi:hypothetical protein
VDQHRLTQATPGTLVTELPSGGVKGVKTARMDLIPFDALWQIALVYGAGAAKYAERNWESGYDWSKSFGALQRHLALFWAGEDNDPETGLPHLAHAGWHCLALMAFSARELGSDDRTLDPDALAKGLATMNAELTNPEIFQTKITGKGG